MAENPLERAVLASGLVPVAMLEAYSPAYARAISTATRLGVFEALSGGGHSAKLVAETCQTDLRATEKLLNLLVTMKYVSYGGGMYMLARNTRRWLLADAPGSIRDVVLMKELEWSWIDRIESFVRDGQPLDVHGTMSTQVDGGIGQVATQDVEAVAVVEDVGGEVGHRPTRGCQTTLRMSQASPHRATWR
jgi:hypothetical protein